MIENNTSNNGNLEDETVDTSRTENIQQIEEIETTTDTEEGCYSYRVLLMKQ